MAINPGGEALLRWRSTLLSYNSSMASWSFASPTCSWFGVTCDAAGHVTELDLSIAGITGRLHAFYSTAYQNLTVLDLNYNNLTGTIPTNISLLVTLTSLDLGTNNLTGAIPYQLSMLPRLAVLNLRSNHLTNPESGKFSPMPSLEVLYLGYNDLHGTFPQFILNSTSRGMLFLQLSGNNFSGPIPSSLPEIFPRLRRLYLSSNRFTGLILRNLSRFQKLEVLHLDMNNPTGGIPKELGMISGLEVLNLGVTI
jgi:hypothetical protein